MKPRVLYISGPMRWIPHSNFPLFDEVANYLRKRDIEVLSPADNDRRVWPEVESAPGFAEGAHVNFTGAPADFTFEKLFVWDVEAIGKADGIVLLPGWRDSVGASLEAEIAKAFKKRILYAIVHYGQCVAVTSNDPEVPQVIGLTGFAQVGKDTAARFLVEHYGFERVAFADRVRGVAYQLNPLVRYRASLLRLRTIVDTAGWEKAKQWPEVRRLLQVLGTEAGRNVLGEDIWVRLVMGDLLPGKRYVISDVRFWNEAKAIWGVNGEVWRIVRPGYGPINKHQSETAMSSYITDAVIINDGSLKDFYNSLREEMTRWELQPATEDEVFI